MRAIALFFLLFTACFAQAQDFVIGGQEKSPTSNEEYDSLGNFYPDPMNAKMMIGQEFTYYNMHNYSNGYFQIPYPWKDGRLRAGRYTSSQTAKNEYLAELKKKSGTKYKLTDFVTYEGQPGYVFTDSKGESIFYTDLMFVNGELICEGYKEKFRKTYVGKEVIFTTEGMRQDFDPQNISEVRNCFVGLQDRELKPSLPDQSKWIIKGVGVDTTYWGNHTLQNDMYNSFCRLVFVVHNDELGDYECFVDFSDMLYSELLPANKISKAHPRFLLLDSLIGKPYPWGKNVATNSWSNTIPADILADAKAGLPNAIYAILNYYEDNIRFGKINNLSYDEYIALLDKVVDAGYIHQTTARKLMGVVRHYIRYVIQDEYDKENDYRKGSPYLIKAARLGNTEAIKTLIECVEKGKINTDEAYQVIEEQAEKESIARIALGHLLLKGEKRINQEKAISWLHQTTVDGKSSSKGDAYFILFECFQKGIGVKKDTKQAQEMLIKAADEGNQTACLNLGEMYYLGEGTTKDFDKASKYLKKGIRIYESDSKFHYMYGKILASKLNDECISYFEAALMSEGSLKYEAAIELGNIYYEGKIAEKDKGRAAEYFWTAYKDGKLEEGRQLFEKYQLKNILIKYLTDMKSENGDSVEEYVNEMMDSIKILEK